MNTVIGRFRTINPDIQHRQKSAITEAMHAVDAANTYLSQQEPWKLGRADPARMETVLHVAAQAVDDCKTLLAPFLPHIAQRIHEQLGRQGPLHRPSRRGRSRRPRWRRRLSGADARR